MIQRLVTLARGLDENGQIGARLRLADKFGQQLRAERGVAAIVGAALRRDDARGRCIHPALTSRRANLQDMSVAISDTGSISFSPDLNSPQKFLNSFGVIQTITTTA